MKQFSDDIAMEFGIEKCAKASFKKGKLTSTANVMIDEYTTIEEPRMNIQIPGCK